jgi:IS66 Orf2 like protein
VLSLPLPGRIFWCTLPTDMRKSFDTLSGLVQKHLGQDPLSGDLLIWPSVSPFLHGWSSLVGLAGRRPGWRREIAGDGFSSMSFFIGSQIPQSSELAGVGPDDPLTWIAGASPREDVPRPLPTIEHTPSQAQLARQLRQPPLVLGGLRLRG